MSPFQTAEIERYGGQVIIVTARDVHGGLLQTRLALIARMLQDDPTLIWTNQYANPGKAV